MLKYINKDLLQAFEDGDCNVILHQENCESQYYAGFAKKLHDKYNIDSNKRIFGCTETTAIKIKDGFKHIVNLYSQYYRGQPSDKEFINEYDYSLKDSLHNRIIALRKCLSFVKFSLGHRIIGIPLLASGLAADKGLKGSMTDLEYFKRYIAPIVEEKLKGLDVTVYYI